VDANLWRFIFFINVPIGIIGVSLGSKFLHEGSAERRPSLDVPGIILSIIAFGSLLFAATNAESSGFTAPLTVFAFVMGTAGLIGFGLFELKFAKEPLLDLRLFKNSIFTNATIVGYVTVLALFGAEFLMPLYLQLLRGRTALETGFVLLGLAATSAITTPLAGKLYDKIGPRILVTSGFVLLVINTWQLAQLKADTSISFIVLLLALRGLAFGLTVQSTFTTALGTVPLPLLPRGSSLTNSTRFVVQAIAVAVLASLLSSALSTQVIQLQNQVQQATSPSQVNVPFGLCETPNVLQGDNLPPGAIEQIKQLPVGQQSSARQNILTGVQAACSDYINGFEHAYQVTFIFAIISLILGAMLPGWPGKWAGRGNMHQTVAAGH
jgi:DHA2 family multidrug resistance protein